MNRSRKQMIVLDFLLMKYPNIKIGTAARILNKWENKTGVKL